MTMTRALRHLAVLVPLVAATGAVAAPFANGSLESSAGGFIQTVAAGASANGWTAVGANIEFVREGYSSSGDTLGAAQDGAWMVDLNGTQGPGGISQTFDTVAGQWYAVDYFMSGNAGPNGSTSGDTKSLAAYWNGLAVDTASYIHQTGDQWSNLRWENHGFLVQASGTQSTLGFSSLSTTYSAAGPLIDAISITPVPEPATALLWAAGVLTLLAGRRRA